MSEKEFKVVSIKDNETIIINGGSEDNIKIEDIFEIIGEGIEIKDPDTYESLGFLENVKETVSVTKVYPKMCECSHLSENSLIRLANATSSLYLTQHRKILNIDNEEICEDIDDKTIHIGDKANLKPSLPKLSTKSTND